ncbi:hypothetical protein T439DRAFT_327865 [Meredithblackwellia eburnea MCA 4105]
MNCIASSSKSLASTTTRTTKQLACSRYYYSTLESTPTASTSNHTPPPPTPPTTASSPPIPKASRAFLPPPNQIHETINNILAPHGYPIDFKIAVRAMTHKSVGRKEEGAIGHNEKLTFLGRRILRLHLTLYLSRVLAPNSQATSRFISTEAIDKILQTRELGATVGKELGLEHALRWREVRGPDGFMTGLYKSRGNALEALVAAVHLSHGIEASNQVFHKLVLPHLSLPASLEREILATARGEVVEDVSEPVVKEEGEARTANP